MGADGFIVDPDQPVTFQVRCYQCSRTIPDGWPVGAEHEKCRQKDGRLPVSVEIDNYEER